MDAVAAGNALLREFVPRLSKQSERGPRVPPPPPDSPGWLAWAEAMADVGPGAVLVSLNAQVVAVDALAFEELKKVWAGMSQHVAKGDPGDIAEHVIALVRGNADLERIPPTHRRDLLRALIAGEPIEENVAPSRQPTTDDVLAILGGHPPETWSAHTSLLHAAFFADEYSTDDELLLACLERCLNAAGAK